jgi:hypothetical protein
MAASGSSLFVSDDQIAPRIFNLQRLTPADARTSADTLTWLFQTNESTIEVDASDFVVSRHHCHDYQSDLGCGWYAI